MKPTARTLGSPLKRAQRLLRTYRVKSRNDWMANLMSGELPLGARIQNYIQTRTKKASDAAYSAGRRDARRSIERGRRQWRAASLARNFT
jgi:hypothetical protein